ncbi:hypothetical protein [Microbacterium elymi]|uniref:Uncharacterized protein n=1 Tax=Microbacterium elymi TaxID=2909587 RepID=A0ABY5NIC9_9MICO|nr:hypothetical protein [Microbacterium elymi]UUT34940.1 hypothetical protein L2X98_31635 [Microbacterium elymi]
MALTMLGVAGNRSGLHPIAVLHHRVEHEVHVVDLHVVGPQRRVVGVEHDRRVLVVPLLHGALRGDRGQLAARSVRISLMYGECSLFEMPSPVSP